MFWVPPIEGFVQTAKGPVYTLHSDREFDRAKPECIGEIVTIAWQNFEVIGVERRLPSTEKIAIGEPIGLLVRPILKAVDHDPFGINHLVKSKSQ